MNDVCLPPGGGKATDAATRTPWFGGFVDERLMTTVAKQVPPITRGCDSCGQKHIFRYSHLKLDKGKRYSVYIGVPCYTEYMEKISG